MATTYEPIATTTLGSAASSITFSSIPATYTDLRVVLQVKAVTGDTLKFRLNNDSGGNYSTTEMNGDGSSVYSLHRSGGSSWLLWYSNLVSTTQWEFHTWDVFSYSSNSFWKTALLTRNADLNGSGEIYQAVGLWKDTSVVNRIDVGLFSENMATGTTATLYGILKA